MQEYIIEDMNLLKDWVNICKQELTNLGYHLDVHGDDKIGVVYFSILKRSITEKPRKIYRSKSFICPTKYEQGLEILSKKILSGSNLHPYLSKSIKQADYQDKLLFDWGIHHFSFRD